MNSDKNTEALLLLLLLFCIRFTDQVSAAQRAELLLYLHQGKAGTLVSQVTFCLMWTFSLSADDDS